MQLPHLADFNTRARSLFQKIYRNQKIDVSKSKDTLKEQLDLYLEHLSDHLKKTVSKKDAVRIIDIIIRNNHVAEIISSKEFRKITENKKKLMDEITLGLIYCIDGRIPAVFLGGRYANHWEVPAAEIKVKARKSDNKLIPESNDLCEALRKLVTTEKELLEVVFAHTSLHDSHHGCGAMAAKRSRGELDKKLTNEEANLKIIENKTIPALTNLYNDFREQKGFSPLLRVGVSAIYDTDTFGIIFNHDRKLLTLSTTELTNEYKDRMDEVFIKDNLVFGSFKERFCYLKYLVAFSQNIYKVTETLLTRSKFSTLSDYLDEYISDNYNDLTGNQKKALKFLICRTIAFQYLTGACSFNKKSLNHPFVKHEEKYMAVSTRGTTIGKYDPQNQGFSSTPADVPTAISNIKTKLSIMSSNKQKDTRLLFICNPVNLHDLSENSIQLHKIMDDNAELFRSILSDKDLGLMVDSLEMIPVPLLIDEDTRAVLKIADHSAYI